MDSDVLDTPLLLQQATCAVSRDLETWALQRLRKNAPRLPESYVLPLAKSKIIFMFGGVVVAFPR